MNRDLLLKHFDRINEAPDAIPRLRRFILDLAVRGKLVEQDPSDEPAAELLKRIQAEKVRLVKEGKVSKQEPFEAPCEDTIPFQVPQLWTWVPATYPACLISDMGKKVQTKDVLGSGEFPVVDQGKVFIRGYSNDAEKVIHVEAPIVLFGDHTRETKLIDFDFIVGADGVKLLMPVCIFSSYYYLALNWLPLDSRGYGRHFKLLRASVLPLPPLAEQHRIVAKVDELMALCDQLEAERNKREAQRDRLVASSLNRISTTTAEEAKGATRFHLNHLPHLTTRTEHIKQLRQTILNLAVRGRLVPQDPNDEPAVELLKRIQAEKARLVKEGKIKKIDSAIINNRTVKNSFLPPSWLIATLLSICDSVTDGDHLPPPKAKSGIPFLVIGNVREKVISFNGSRFVSTNYYEALDPIRRPQSGDLLYTLVGSYGIPVIVRDDKPFCVQRHIGILRPSKLINVNYLAYAMESKQIFDQATDCATGIAQKTVPLSGLRLFPIPLPPLAEQHRIVAKVDELMALCDQLEANLNTTEADSRRLLEAVLRDALNPVVKEAARTDNLFYP
jgi:type I restriction enzyme S subunit